MARSADFSVLFLLAPAPGRVVHAVRKAAKATPELAGEYRLSTPLAPHGWRVLCFPASVPVTDLATVVSRALPLHPVTVLQADAQHWSGTVYQKGACTEAVDGTVARANPAGLTRLLQWLGVVPVVSPPLLWAIARDLPASLLARSHRWPSVEYVTVESLEARSLLVENAPHWYIWSVDGAKEK